MNGFIRLETAEQRDRHPFIEVLCPNDECEAYHNYSSIDIRKMYRCRFSFSSLLSLVVFYSLFASVKHGSALEDAGQTDLFNYCLDGMHHKVTPGPESSLHNLCTPWKNRSCCTHNTTERIHDLTLYRPLNYSQCQPLSEPCKEYFIKDLCFYECSPNVGPWVEKVEGMKVRREQYKNVPLCKSDCDRWFNACKNDFVCSRNWIESGKCNNQSYCLSIEDVYHSAKSFCEEIWDHSWVYTPDDEPCMKMWFDPALGNPNDAVTLAVMKPKQLRQYTGEAGTATILLVSFSLLSVVLIVFIFVRKDCHYLQSSMKFLRFRSD